MQPEQTPQEPEVTPEPKQSVWNKVTPLSKYSTMALFVILPFVGGYLGYTYAPEKIMEVEKIVVVEKEVGNEAELRQVIEKENKTYRNYEYSFAFEYPREYSIPSNINRIPGDDPFFEEYLDDDKSRITFSSGDGLTFTLYGVDHDLGKEGYGRPICTNSLFDSSEDCVRKKNQVGTEYFEREVRRNYGWEKGYEFKVNDDLSLIIVHQGGDDRDFEKLNEYQVALIDTFRVVNDKEKLSVTFAEFSDVTPADYPLINKEYFDNNPSQSRHTVPEDVGVRRALRLNENILLLEVYGTDGGPFVTTLVYDEVINSVIREDTYPYLALSRWYDNSKLLYVGGAANTIEIKDYINDKTVVLYEESDPGVQLVEVWEMGQVGELDVNEDSVIFGRYRKLEGTTGTEFIEEMRVPIPQSLLSE